VIGSPPEPGRAPFGRRSVPPKRRQLLRTLVPRQQEEYAHPVEGLSDDWMNFNEKENRPAWLLHAPGETF
jgi:hypothetical protein